MAAIDDSAIDVEQWIADEVQTVFAEQEGAAFVSGNGTDKPKGFLAYTTVADASWSWGNIGYIATGVSGGFAASTPSDALFNLIYALRAGYRIARHSRFVGTVYHLPRLLHRPLQAIMRATGTEMQLIVYLRKHHGA